MQKKMVSAIPKIQAIEISCLFESFFPAFVSTNYKNTLACKLVVQFDKHM